MTVDRFEGSKTLMQTHKVIIDANNAEHAAYLVEALRNDGYRAHREVQAMVRDDAGNITLQRARVPEGRSNL